MATLSVQHLKQYFGGVKAVDDVSLGANPGEVNAIIGPNGAGKTTVINAITTFQNIELFEHASVVDNIQLGYYRHRKSSLVAELLHLPSAKREAMQCRLAAEKVLSYLELESSRDIMVSGLAYGLRKQVELGRALCADPTFLVLDEPASGLTREETLDLGYFIRDLATRRGIGVLMIEHDMGLVSRVADHVIAMNEGRVIARGTAAEVQANPDVIECYLGSKAA